ncbi:MAG: dihydroorotate dehydrogenase [Nanoarchaeota archaeon]|nr:dihydroorotate dehydrogenase [Nanoarchaeota archaeon]
MATYSLFGKPISGPFTIPSGIVMTEVPVLERIANEIPEIGILTTKSIGPEPKEGNREPILAQYTPFSFINAVGLANPGCKEFAERLKKAKIPKDKFLLASIFGSTEQDIKHVAGTLVSLVDGFELNISCPHSKRYGQACGQDPELVEKLTHTAASFGKPVVVKISPNLDMETTIKAALGGGARGFVAINTKGPTEFKVDGHDVLSNKQGGVSGKAILNLGIACVKKIRHLTDKPIIACGGISTAEDIKRYKKAGASFFGIGSALAGMNTSEMKLYFKALKGDFETGSDAAPRHLKETNMKYVKFKIAERRQLADNLILLKLDKNYDIQPGQFIFAWIPGKGEKPFAIFDDEPATLLFKPRGRFTDELAKLNPGDPLYIRGPYGNPLKIRGKALLVVGGTAVAALHLLAKRKPDTCLLVGGEDKKHLSFLKEFPLACKEVSCVSDDGSYGEKGLVTDILERHMLAFKPDICINCGPEQMQQKAIEIEKKHIKPENILSSIEYQTMCGNGICGRCATPAGERSCVDGTFFPLKH